MAFWGHVEDILQSHEHNLFSLFSQHHLDCCPSLSSIGASHLTSDRFECENRQGGPSKIRQHIRRSTVLLEHQPPITPFSCPTDGVESQLAPNHPSISRRGVSQTLTRPLTSPSPPSSHLAELPAAQSSHLKHETSVPLPDSPRRARQAGKKIPPGLKCRKVKGGKKRHSAEYYTVVYARRYGPGFSWKLGER